MLIGIEASRANRLQKTGVEWYAYHIIQELKKLPEALSHSWLLYTGVPLMNGLERGTSNWHEVCLSWPPKFLWTQIRLSFEMFFRPPDVLFVPAHVLPRAIPKRTFVTIHDVGFHRFPDLYKPIQRAYHEWSTKDIVRHGAHILTVSEFSKQEIIEFYGAEASNISVVYPGINHNHYQPLSKEACHAILSRWNLPKPYVLFIGRLEKKKNVETLVAAFHRYKEQRGEQDPLELILVGQPGVGYEDLKRAIETGAGCESIRVVGYVNEEEKVALLSAATAYVHPSWYEGFGIPPIEAMACGCPVICSSAASLPEVVGIENALWFAPHDVDALVHALAQTVDDAGLRADLRELGLGWCKRYRWDTAAHQILHLLTVR